MKANERRPFLEHLQELRTRALRIGVGVTASAALSFKFSGRILEWLIRPVGKVVFLNPTEPFWVHLKVALVLGVALTFPLIAWEVWGFLTPALGPRVRRFGILFILMSMILFIAGAWFGWKVLLPAALTFLLSFSSEVMSPMITVGSYIEFAGWLVAACGFVFQMPMGVVLLTRLGWVNSRQLLRQWRLCVVGILIAAAVLTPTPDIFDQLLLSLPMTALYLISIGLSFLVEKRESLHSEEAIGDPA